MSKVNPIQLQRFLSGVDYPAEKDDLINHARGQGADERVLETLEAIPDKEYETPAEVSKEAGKVA